MWKEETTSDVDPGKDAFFVLNGHTFMRLLRVRADGTFAVYSREHMYVGISDEGRWRQLDDGTLLLCSHYESDRDGTLTRQKVMRFDGLTWLSEPDDDVEKELLGEYRRYKGRPFLSGVARVGVDAKTFEELLGTRQSFMYRTEMNQVIPRKAPLSDLRGKRIKVPECGAYKELAGR
jgi:hypothetical protein